MIGGIMIDVNIGGSDSFSFNISSGSIGNSIKCTFMRSNKSNCEMFMVIVSDFLK
ncbi:unnamed protein product [Schistosoma mattheei]|uniref:Uncharacterized protein n=1 Tax=Schistosoma mattheei TaxID=31246 RepID=A0A183NHH5_9TREM|nr:unnamed protein product [Schistosoma mattheei]